MNQDELDKDDPWLDEFYGIDPAGTTDIRGNPTPPAVARKAVSKAFKGNPPPGIQCRAALRQLVKDAIEDDRKWRQHDDTTQQTTGSQPPSMPGDGPDRPVRPVNRRRPDRSNTTDVGTTPPRKRGSGNHSTGPVAKRPARSTPKRVSPPAVETATPRKTRKPPATPPKWSRATTHAGIRHANKSTAERQAEALKRKQRREREKARDPAGYEARYQAILQRHRDRRKQLKLQKQQQTS